MGYIKEEVLHNNLLTEQDQELARFFSSCFNINYGNVENIANTTVSVFIMEPEDFLSEGFGLEKEIMLIISHYEEMDSRTLRAADELLLKYPYKNRVDNLCYFLVAENPRIEDWIRRNYDSSINCRILFPFSINEIKRKSGDNWYIREKLRKYSFDKDLFGYTLPLNDDSSFFGRQQIIGRYIDAIRRCQNRGIFGLRKTGKTSLLYKIKRTVVEQQLGQVFYFDCKNPAIRKKRWYELLEHITLQISGRLKLANFSIDNSRQDNVLSAFNYVLKKAKERNTKIILIFDEIEYISYFAKLNTHWAEDYLDFWQTIWSEQSTYGNLCFIVCGVNAYVSEKDTINGVQNPLFGIVISEYLTGLSFDETATMIKTLGKRMGLKFDHDAIQCLYEQYGGHPMLTRMACSWANKYLQDEQRPISLTKVKVKALLKDIDTDSAFYSYFGHIVSEIQQFYPDEYEMLEILATGQADDFIELSQINEFVSHLKSYGLIAYRNGVPYIAMPVAGRYIALEQAKKEKRKIAFKLVEKEKRKEWLKCRIDVLIEHIRMLENSIRVHAKDELYGINSFPEAEKLKEIKEATNRETFAVFINTFYRCFVEAIANYGKSRNDSKYLEKVLGTYKTLGRTFDKIREYRNEQDHLLLTDYHKTKLDEYREEDIEPTLSYADQYFCLQQKIVIELIVSIYSELFNLE
jgi:hypothetical protein